MRRSTAKVKILAGAMGLVLTLPLSFASAAVFPVPESSAPTLAELSQASNVLDAWRQYALADLNTGYSWNAIAVPAQIAPSVFDRADARIMPPASHFAGVRIKPPVVQVSYLHTSVADTPAISPTASPQWLQDSTPGLKRYVVAPSFSQPWGENSAVSVSAIFAYQRFAGLGLGQDAVPMQGGGNFAIVPAAFRNNPASYGTGLRVDFNSALTTRLSWQVGYQSRVNMDSFNNYRGVYSEPGSFDIPASADFGIGYALTPRLKLDLGVERVMYSQIAPFTSDALPTRFLVLLGSSVSPAFAWQDLDVYSAGWTWHDPSDGMWSVRYSTRQQPVPTSQLLQNALEPYLASHEVEFRFAHAFGDTSRLRLGATYAPAQFVLGLPTSNYLRNNGGGGQIEYEATWTTLF